MRSRTNCYLVFALLLMIPSILTCLFPDDSASVELRKVQEFPPFPENAGDVRDYPRKLNNYINDHFLLRGRIISSISRVLYDYGISINRDIIFGQDRWMFLAVTDDVIAKYRGAVKLSPREAAAWARDMSARVDFLKKRGIKCWFVIVPEKSSVYSSELPPWCTKEGPNFTDTLVQGLKKQQDIKWIDLRPFLIEESARARIYHLYDTHWNDYGSYLAYEYIMRELQKELRLECIGRGEVLFVREQVSGDLARALSLQDYLREDTYVAIIPRSSVIYQTKVQDITKGWTAITSKKSAPRAVILCDSYVNGIMKKYLQETFSVAYFKHHNGMEFKKDDILREHPDVVLNIVAERLIPSELPEASF